MEGTLLLTENYSTVMRGVHLKKRKLSYVN